MIKVRVDDFPYGAPQGNCSVAVIKELERLKIPYYLAVVPFFISEGQISYIQRLEYCTVAMHGFDHAHFKWTKTYIPSDEFDGVSYEEIFEKLVLAHRILKYFIIDTFIPPFNRFTQNLLDVLNDNGYKTITGGPETETQMDCNKLNFGNIKLVLSKGKFYTSNGNLKGILNTLEELPKDEMITLHLNGCYAI